MYKRRMGLITLGVLSPMVAFAAPEGVGSPVLGLLANPDVAWLVLLVGLLGLLFEVVSPGLAVPGLVGGALMLLALFALQDAGANMAPLVPMVSGLLLLVLPALRQGAVALAWAGVALFSLGGIWLLLSPALEVHVPIMAGLTLGMAGFFLWLVLRLRTVRERPGLSGAASLLGRTGHAADGFEREGRVIIEGVSWTARTGVPLAAGQEVKVTQINGLTMTVEPIQE